MLSYLARGRDQICLKPRGRLNLLPYTALCSEAVFFIAAPFAIKMQVGYHHLAIIMQIKS